MNHQIEAVIFDWAGTLVDYGCFAPTRVLIDAFASMNIQIDLATARGPMGVAKRDHINALCQLAQVATQWQNLYQRLPNQQDINALYQRFLPLQIEQVALYSDVIAGAIKVVDDLKARGSYVGSCSGYPESVMTHVIAHAKRAGLQLDYAVASDQVKAARPAPNMILKNLLHFGISDVGRCVKVDDTPVGILEGTHAGVWTVGVCLSGNAVGLIYDQVNQLTASQQAQLRAQAIASFAQAKPHYFIDSIADLPVVLEEINQKIAAGIRP